MNEPKNFRAIMLSSTFTDLRKHREQVIKAIREFGYKAEVMEDSGARADVDVIDSSLKMVQDSVAYALIIGRKYGQTPICPERNPNQFSVTELEFNEAMRLKRPILLFIMDKTHPIIEDDIELDPDKRKKLEAFRERAKRMRDGQEVQRVYQTFESLEQFATAAAIAIGKLARQLEQRELAVRSSAITTAAEIPMQLQVLSNIPVNVPLHFLGRDQDLAAIDAALKRSQGRVAITALHGLRGVGKTTLAAAYAEQHRASYRATWWIRAETESTMRADLVGLGVGLGWIAADAAEEPALKTVIQRLGEEGNGILIVYDNAKHADEVRPYLPRSGVAQIIVTSNAPDWRGVATHVEIEVWPKDVGADYLIARTGRRAERVAALELSEMLGGLPLAHEQAAAYCARLGISIVDYLMRFESNPAKLLNVQKDASFDYGRTVATTFALAIDEAAKLHPAAEPLIVYAALLAPEPIPLFLFSEAREKLGEPFASAFAGDGLDEAVAALRAFALVDREVIPDERDPSITTDSIRLHRLVRQVAAARWIGAEFQNARRRLIAALAAIYPDTVFDDPRTWPRARRLDALLTALIDFLEEPCAGEEKVASYLLNRLASYRQRSLAAYGEAQLLFERGLAICEKAFGPDHPDTATSLNDLAFLLQERGDLAGARPLLERASAICDKTLGADHPDTARNLLNLGTLMRMQGDFVGAQKNYDRALAIFTKAYGPRHPATAITLGNLGALSEAQDSSESAQTYYEQAQAIYDKTSPDHLDTATNLSNLGRLLQKRGDLEGARSYYERALSIREHALGPNHPDRARSLNDLGFISNLQGDHAVAWPCYKRALEILGGLGIMHSLTQIVARNAYETLGRLKLDEEAAALSKKYALRIKGSHPTRPFRH